MRRTAAAVWLARRWTVVQPGQNQASGPNAGSETAEKKGMLHLGMALALLCAIASNLAFLCKYRGAIEAPKVQFAHPWETTKSLFQSRWWTIGWVVGAFAFALHVAALALAPLSLVQAVIAGGIVTLAIPAQLWFGIRLRPREWAGLALSGAGLAFLAITVESGTGTHSSYTIGDMAIYEGAALGLGVALLHGGCRGLGFGRISNGVMFGVASGLLLGVSDVAIKALTGTVPGEPLSIISPWSAIALTGGILAFFGLARGLQSGGAIEVIALSSVAANCAAMLGGVIVFGDPMGADAASIATRGLAFAAVIVAAALVPMPQSAPNPGRALTA